MNNNDNDLKPQQTWTQAEEMLDSHFRRKKVIRWTLSLAAVLFMAFLSTYLVQEPLELTTMEKGKGGIEKGNADDALPSTGQQDVVAGEKRLTNTEEQKIIRKKSSGRYPVNSTAQFLPPVRNLEEKAEEQQIATISGNSFITKPDDSSPAQAAGEDLTIGVTTGHLENAGNLIENTDQPSPGGMEPQNNPPVFPASSNVDFLSPIHTAFASGVNIISARSETVSAEEGKKMNIKLLVYSSVQCVSKTIDSKTYPDYASRRSAEEKGILTNAFGASLVHEKKKFSFGIGIEYSGWGEKVDYSPYSMQNVIVDNGSWNPYYRLENDTSLAYIYGNQYTWIRQLQVLDSAYNFNYDTVVQNAYDGKIAEASGTNRLHYFEIPIAITYHFNHNRISTGISFGISPAWLVGRKGYYLMEDMNGVVSLDKAELNRFVLNSWVGLQVNYMLNKRFNLVLEPLFKTNLFSVFNDGSGITQRYYAVAWKMGLMYSIK